MVCSIHTIGVHASFVHNCSVSNHDLAHILEEELFDTCSW
jgi:hypothetical protein